ncbi:MAG: hypothetical protein ACW9XB_05630 [Candidatus Nitrosopumilus sp. metabat.KBP569_Feb_25m_nospike.7]
MVSYGLVLLEMEVKDRRYDERKEGILCVHQIAGDIEIIEK